MNMVLYLIKSLPLRHSRRVCLGPVCKPRWSEGRGQTWRAGRQHKREDEVCMVPHWLSANSLWDVSNSQGYIRSSDLRRLNNLIKANKSFCLNQQMYSCCKKMYTLEVPWPQCFSAENSQFHTWKSHHSWSLDSIVIQTYHTLQHTHTHLTCFWPVHLESTFVQQGQLISPQDTIETEALVGCNTHYKLLICSHNLIWCNDQSPR